MRSPFSVEEKNLNIINAISSKNVPQWGNKKQFIAIYYLGVVGQNNKVESGGYGAHYYIYWDGTIYQRKTVRIVKKSGR